MRTLVKLTAVMFVLGWTGLLAQPVKIGFVGNSITYGYGLNDPEVNSYPGQLQMYLGDDYEVGNFSVSGCTMLRNGNHPIWEEPRFADALAFQPDILFILLGTNDSKPLNWDDYKYEFYSDYVAMVDTFSRGATPPEVWACLPPPAFAVQFDIRDSVIVNEIIPVINQVIADKGLNRIDLRTPFLNQGHLFPDDIHPNLDGSNLMAKIVYEALTGDSIRQANDVNVLLNTSVTADEDPDVAKLNDGLWYTVWTPDAFPVSCVFDAGATVTVDAFAIVPDTLDRVFQYTVEISEDNVNWTMLIDQSSNQDPPASAYVDTVTAVDLQYLKLTLLQGGSISEVKALQYTGFHHAPMVTVTKDLETKTYVYYYLNFTPVTRQDEMFCVFRNKGDGAGFATLIGYKNLDYTQYRASVPKDQIHEFFLLTYLDGTEIFSPDTISIFDVGTAVQDPNTGMWPNQIRLSAGYPNPFNPATHFSFSADRVGKGLVQIINLRGQVVRTLFERKIRPGKTYVLQWDGRNSAGKTMSSGTYFVRFSHPGGVKTQKVLLIR